MSATDSPNIPPAECGDYPAPCNHDPAHVTPPGQISTRGLDTSQPRPTTPGEVTE